MRVKVCGLTLMRDLRLAERAGAEWVGVVVEAPSPRAVGRDVAVVLSRAARKPVVFVVVDMPVADMNSIAHAARPAAFQLHGSERVEAVAEARRELPSEMEIWRALVAGDDTTEQNLGRMLSEVQELSQAGVARIVLDTRAGGRGPQASPRLNVAFARDFVAASPLPCLVAGGLSVADLVEVWETVRPFGMDLSSGLEQRPGIKDPARMRELEKLLGMDVS
ncbi:MAG: phosphoribosylanthranilate isomerase [Armatimonadetes bacterium]|nr:phosphoribosylanthranilate isomerase [Armatimonadota bacterium]